MAQGTCLCSFLHLRTRFLGPTVIPKPRNLRIWRSVEISNVVSTCRWSLLLSFRGSTETKMWFEQKRNKTTFWVRSSASFAATYGGSKVKVKCTFVQALRLCTGRTVLRGSRGLALLFLYHGTRRGWVVSSTPRPQFTPGKDPVPIVQEAGWGPGSVWTGAESVAPTGIRSPDRPARSSVAIPTELPGAPDIAWDYSHSTSWCMSTWRSSGMIGVLFNDVFQLLRLHSVNYIWIKYYVTLVQWWWQERNEVFEIKT